MSIQITLKIPDEVAHQAQVVAETTQRRVEDVLTEWLDRAASELPVSQLPDTEVRALANMQMPDSEQAELSNLLQQQREDSLTVQERERLALLMQTYRKGLVRKSQAIRVAVERGLMPPLG